MLFSVYTVAEHSGMVHLQNTLSKEVKPIPSIYSEELNKLRDNKWDDINREVVERLPTFNSAKSSTITEENVCIR
jgi:hypothetical protein